MKARLFKYTRYRVVGDSGLLVEYGEGIDPDVNEKVRTMAGNLDKKKLKGVLEIIPAYHSLLISYDPDQTHPFLLEYFLKNLAQVS